MFDELKEFGLSDNEIAIYTTLIKAGITTANHIANVTGIKRSTTYDTLHALISQGIVSGVTKDNVQLYAATEPTKLLALMDAKRQKVASIIPQLEQLSVPGLKKTGVTYYEGKKGVMTVLNDILDTAKGSFIYMGSRTRSKDALSHYPDNFAVKRVAAGLHVEGFLAHEDKADDFITRTKAAELSEFSYAHELDGSSAIMFIYEDRVSFITNHSDPVGVIITNKEIARFMETLYAWIKSRNTNKLKIKD